MYLFPFAFSLDKVLMLLDDIKSRILNIPKETRELAIILGIILFVGIFFILTIRDGHDWGDDFSVYIRHAKNIVERTEYRNTDYIYNPLNPVSPKTEPPIFPIMLSIVYNFFGLNLYAMKILEIVLFMMVLLLIYILFKDNPSNHS